MKNRAPLQVFTFGTAILFIGALSLDVDARGRGGAGARGMAGGGGGFSHAGPARGGSFAARSAPRAATGGGAIGQADRSDRAGSRQDFRTDTAQGRQDMRGERQDNFSDGRDDRQDHRDEYRDDRQDYRDDVRDDRQDYYDDRYDRWDNWGTGAAVVAGAAIVGSAITAAAYYDLDCTTVVVDGVSYSDCGSTWYQPAYSGGDVTYVVVDPPPGY
jgi:hypothetical protein